MSERWSNRYISSCHIRFQFGTVRVNGSLLFFHTRHIIYIYGYYEVLCRKKHSNPVFNITIYIYISRMRVHEYVDVYYTAWNIDPELVIIESHHETSSVSLWTSFSRVSHSKSMDYIKTEAHKGEYVHSNTSVIYYYQWWLLGLLHRVNQLFLNTCLWGTLSRTKNIHQLVECIVDVVKLKIVTLC